MCDSVFWNFCTDLYAAVDFFFFFLCEILKVSSWNYYLECMLSTFLFNATPALNQGFRASLVIN